MPPYVGAGVGGVAAACRDTTGESLQALYPSRAKHDLGTALCERKRSCLTFSAAGSGDRNDLVVDARHGF
jgi:hypothetical protein